MSKKQPQCPDFCCLSSDQHCTLEVSLCSLPSSREVQQQSARSVA